jgi:hypothetical protein
VDQGYEAQWLKDWAAGLKQTHKIDVEVVERQGQGSVISRCHRLSRLLFK